MKRPLEFLILLCATVTPSVQQQFPLSEDRTKLKIDKPSIYSASYEYNHHCYGRGTVISGTCYSFEMEAKNFDDARQSCNVNGGDLWTPDFKDPYLIKSLMEHFPKMFKQTGDKVWLGVIINDGSVISLGGVNVKSDPWLNIGSTHLRDVVGYRCAAFLFAQGAVVPVDEHCETVELPYVCEYPEPARLPAVQTAKPIKLG